MRLTKWFNSLISFFNTKIVLSRYKKNRPRARTEKRPSLRPRQTELKRSFSYSDLLEVTNTDTGLKIYSSINLFSSNYKSVSFTNELGLSQYTISSPNYNSPNSTNLYTRLSIKSKILEGVIILFPPERRVKGHFFI